VVAVINAGTEVRNGKFNITLPLGISFVSSKAYPGSVGSPKEVGQTLSWEDLEIGSQKIAKISLTVFAANNVSGLHEILSFFADPDAHCILGPYITEVSLFYALFSVVTL
jgi:hypothetical protein